MMSFKKIITLLAIAAFSSTPTQVMSQGSLEVIYGPMYAGKTTKLIDLLKEAEGKGKKVIAFKHTFDTRYTTNKLTTHDRKDFPAAPISSESADILKIIKFIETSKADVIGIDEIQFFPKLILQVISMLVENDKRVIVAGLDLDFRQESFGIMPQVLNGASKQHKLTANCAVCSSTAPYSQRLINGHAAAYDDPVVMPGAKDLYEPRCGNCFKIRKS